jgi:hypothetical protein
MQLALHDQPGERRPNQAVHASLTAELKIYVLQDNVPPSPDDSPP